MKKILKGEKAKAHFKEVLDNERKGVFKHPNVNNIKGGYWIENGVYVAFDAESNYTLEEFSDKEEAKKYSRGIQAITKGGFKI